MTRARIAVVGAGWWSTYAHLPALAAFDGAEIAAVVDPDPDRCDAAADAFGVDVRLRDIASLAGSDVADGVIIATPHRTHAGLARAALDAGLHTFIEKPMTLSPAEAWDLVDRASRGGLHLMVGYTQHFTTPARRAREVIASGGIGELVLVSALYASAVGSLYAGDVSVVPGEVARPLADTYSTAQGGQARTQVTHAAGMLSWLTGMRIKDIHAFAAHRGFGCDVVDAAAWRYEDGALGTLASTGLVGDGEPGLIEYRMWGTSGSLVLAGGLEVYGPGRDSVPPDEDPWPMHAPAQRFADLICGRSNDNPCSGEVGARAVELVEAIASHPTP